MVIFMASNLEKISSETAEDKAIRVGKTACKREACAIQACLQGIYRLVNQSCTLNRFELVSSK